MSMTFSVCRSPVCHMWIALASQNCNKHRPRPYSACVCILGTNIAIQRDALHTQNRNRMRHKLIAGHSKTTTTTIAVRRLSTQFIYENNDACFMHNKFTHSRNGYSSSRYTIHAKRQRVVRRIIGVHSIRSRAGSVALRDCNSSLEAVRVHA